MNSLQTDSIFANALRSNPDLMEAIGGRLYGTAIPMPEEHALNVEAPYIIVFFDGLQNDTTTKDDPYEGDYDRVSVSIGLCAKTLDKLGELAQTVRETIHNYFIAEETAVADYHLSAAAKQYDEYKPAWNMELKYDCDVLNATVSTGDGGE